MVSDTIARSKRGSPRGCPVLGRKRKNPAGEKKIRTRFGRENGGKRERKGQPETTREKKNNFLRSISAALVKKKKENKTDTGFNRKKEREKKWGKYVTLHGEKKRGGIQSPPTAGPHHTQGEGRCGRSTRRKGGMKKRVKKGRLLLPKEPALGRGEGFPVVQGEKGRRKKKKRS